MWTVVAQRLLLMVIPFLLVACSHALRITNLDSYFSPAVAPLAKPLKLGLTSGSVSDFQTSRYVTAIEDALRRHGSVERVIYPYNDTSHREMVDVVLDISINPQYSGEGLNFLVNWPGFLIWAPAIWGYGYNAEIQTIVTAKQTKGDRSHQMTIPIKYEFRQAEMDRTWTEIGWLEWGVIPLIGGIVFTQYDPDVTYEFITKVSSNYGTYVAGRILEGLAGFEQ